MPRIEFDNLMQAERWLKEFIIPSDRKYVGYFTDRKELILVPTKSTRPVIYGYIRNAERKKVEQLLEEKAYIRIFDIENFEWNAERAISRSE